MRWKRWSPRARSWLAYVRRCCRSSVSVRRSHLPNRRELCEWQQGVDVAVLGGGQSGKDVGEPGVRFKAVGLGGGKQAHDGCSTPPGGFGAGEEPVLATDGNGPDGILDGVVVDRPGAVVEQAHPKKGSGSNGADLSIMDVHKGAVLHARFGGVWSIVERVLIFV